MDNPQTSELQRKLDNLSTTLNQAQTANQTLDTMLDDSYSLSTLMSNMTAHSLSGQYNSHEYYAYNQRAKRANERQYYSVNANITLQNEILHSDNYAPVTLSDAEEQQIRATTEGSKKAKNKAVKAEKKRREEDRNLELKRQEARFAELKASTKSGAFEKVSIADINNEWVSKNIFDKKVKVPDVPAGKMSNRELYNEAISGNYSHLEFLDPVLRLQLATDFMTKLKIENKTEDSYDVTPQGFIEQLAKAHGTNIFMHPLFRLGISIGMKSRDMVPILGDLPFTAGEFAQIEDLLNAKIMSATISKIPTMTEMQRLYGVDDTIPVGANLENDKKRSDMLESIERNQKSQIFIAKLLLAGHIKNITKTQNGSPSKWSNTISTAYAHCSRVGIILPGQKVAERSAFSVTKEKATIDSFTGADGGLKAGFFRRGAATHSLRKKSKLDETKGYKEEKTLGTFTNQFGMNVAIGGLGSNGISGDGAQPRQLNNDGSCGHIYMHKQIGDSSTYTSLLVGFESDSYQKTNQLGHTHGFGNGEYASSFGGMRVDEIGDKYGGRTLDLSEIDAEKFEQLMNCLEVKMQELYNNPTEDNIAYLRQISDFLSGSFMNSQAFNDFMTIVDVPDELSDYFHRIHTKEMR